VKRTRPPVISALAAASIAAAIGALVIAGFASPSSAGASPITRSSLGGFHPVKIKGARHAGPGGNLYYHNAGAPVETAPLIYVSWWGPQWASGFSTGGYTSAQAQTYMTGFFGNVGGSSWDNIDTQYCEGVPAGTVTCGGGGTHVTNPSGQLAGTWNDTSSLPRRISQSGIASAAVRLMNHFGGYNPNATYFVFTPSGHSMSGFGTQWCAWHSTTSFNGNAVAYAYMPYQPDAGVSCGANFVNGSNDSYGNGYFDGFSVVGGHEYAEAVTDPNVSSSGAAWQDSGGAEIGDKCAWASNSTNITLGSHYYAVQPLWSNASGGGSCVTSY
jgi:hypothetical protein